VDERRRRLLELGRGLFTRVPYDELSMSAIAREAGISKALLYHYFPSKPAFFAATLQEAAAELAERVRPDASLPPAAQLAFAVDAWLAWVDANRDGYAKLLRSTGSVPEIRELVDRVRADTAELIVRRLTGADAPPPPALRVAVKGWLAVMDETCLDWVEHGDLDRARVRGILLGALPGLLAAAGHGELLPPAASDVA
jgi:AcrR family transcriptional regulator